ncbi:MAG: hypothetical protein WCB71_09580, partial [Aestuariivirga sp.]
MGQELKFGWEQTLALAEMAAAAEEDAEDMVAECVAEPLSDSPEPQFKRALELVLAGSRGFKNL